MLGLYIDCIGVPDGIFTLQQETSDFFLGLYAGCCDTDLLQPCPNLTSSDSGLFDYCFKNSGVYNAGVDSGRASQQQYCAITELRNTCPSSPGALRINAFLKENETLLNSGVLPSGIALTVFGVLLLLAFIASSTLLCCPSESSSKAPPPQQRYAQETAYGGKPQTGGDNRHINYA